MVTPIISISVPTWKIHHKKLSPAFNQHVLNGFMDVFNRQSSVMVEAMAKELGKEGFDAYAYTGAGTLEMICRTCIYLLRQVVKKKRSDFIAKKKNDENGPETARPFRAFLDLMLELTAKEGIFTEKEIREEVDTIIAAGQETTGYAMLYILLLLGAHQEQQQKVYNEIREIFGDSDRDVTKEDLTHLVYLETSIKESMRIYPVAPVVFRQIDRELKLSHLYQYGGSSGVELPNDEKENNGLGAGTGGPTAWAVIERILVFSDN
ncbi:Cytochrome P450 4V2 [Eumeta japonica]|uniref:Cytochrome P450 4V2 n=1 Tax=Eumeta variegata TaxID=151549 RepID=A0A4C1V1V0_EUMVA|nr:Cytochrome P450 4V2 [Eumeta japonica]